MEKLVEKKNSVTLPVRSLLRHRNELTLKTQGIFQNPGGTSGYRYWLNLQNGSKFLDKRFEKLLRLIFPNKLSYQEYQKLTQLLEEIAYEKAKYVRANFDFINASYDHKIGTGIRKLAL